LTVRKPFKLLNETGFIPIVRRWWWLLALGALGAAAAANTLAKREAPTYASTARVLVGPLNTDFAAVRAAGDLGRTYAEVAKSLPILKAVAARTHAQVTAPELAQRVKASSNDVTRLVTLEVENTDPKLAAQLANALAAELIAISQKVAPEESEAIREFMSQSEITRQPAARQEAIHAAAIRVFGAGLAGRLRMIDPAVPSASPVAPRVTLLTVLGGLAGLALAAIVVLIGSAHSARRSERRAVGELEGVPFFGTFERTAGRKLLAESGAGRAAESYRLLATKIGFFSGRRPVTSLVVFGADGEETSGLVAANLASVLADGHSRILLVDAACGVVTRLLELEDRPGYADLLRTGAADRNGAFDELRVERNERLHVLPAGAGETPSLLDVERANRLLARFARAADIVVLAAPPIDRSPVGLVWARVADGTVVVAEGESREAVEEAAASLDLVGARLLGTVIGRGRRLRLPRLGSARRREREAA
jgi:capsular polysaccharide biosynthesis protein